MLIPVFDELKTMIRSSGLPIRYIAYRAGVSRETIMFWLVGVTNCPRIDTMVRVAEVLGQHIELTGNVKKMVAHYPPSGPIKPPPVVRPRFAQWRLQ